MPNHEQIDIALNDDQQQGILACLQNKVTIITGGPGTGKTTLIKNLLDILMNKKYAISLLRQQGAPQNVSPKVRANMQPPFIGCSNLIRQAMYLLAMKKMHCSLIF